MTKRNKMNECYSCIYKRDVPGNCHIACTNPDRNLVGSPHGIKNGWFMYPILFDPVWKETDCANYKTRGKS